MITKATNNQTNVQLAALHATDKVQIDIDEALLKYGYYYERRTNFYKNQGVDNSRIIQPLYIAPGYVSLVLKHPFQASKLKNKFMRNANEYNKIFNNQYDLSLWYKIIEILKFTDRNLDKYRSKNIHNEGFLKKWRHIISFIYVARILGKYNYSIHDLIEIDVSKIKESELKEIWSFLSENLPKVSNTRLGSRQMNIGIELCSEEFNIDCPESILNRKSNTSRERSIITLSGDFVDSVNNLLPEQPWKPGMHHSIIKQLGCSKSDYFKATSILIEQGKRYKQKDGILYDSGGNIIMIDENRVDKETLCLKT